MVTADDLRKEYTKLLARESKAESYIKDPTRTPDELGKWIPEYQKLLDRLAELLAQIKHYTPDNIANGWPYLLNPQQEKQPEPKTPEFLEQLKIL